MKDEKFDDIGFAKLDVSRENRTGTSEAIFCPGKTKEQLLKILETFVKNGCSVLGTKCTKEQANFVQEMLNGTPGKSGATDAPAIRYDETSRILTMKVKRTAKRSANAKVARAGRSLKDSVAVCCAGTADLPIAEEAAQTAEFFGAKVERHFDVGIAGIHRLLSKMDEIRKADVIIAVAGMEGALAGVIAGLTKAPVIAVPTSVGYGASFNGLSPLLTMLNTCAEGVSVVNIDNGYGAAVSAVRMLRIKK
ncbi:MULTISPECIES: nickel pincer cofactor biosynthesis protein LarB [unclassified Fibrobacter]|uniref:nickel pincer cofactor biosynthesis protein LarB n=1 Tax=unclassified Fibrobacter TaxID=2634177 RepID=UPI000916B111|nr:MULTISPECIES: nickel pincer cofactor biosynthesis protein LarB [unclassified Fibrobacter]OWV07913.1 hypothetical protein B7992_13915 [Fibrobacter sp. UWH1]SHK68067.1 hypothetical protein SAMN05720764_10311 [Fibrobacter sp. UWH5]